MFYVRQFEIIIGIIIGPLYLIMMFVIKNLRKNQLHMKTLKNIRTRKKSVIFRRIWYYKNS